MYIENDPLMSSAARETDQTPPENGGGKQKKRGKGKRKALPSVPAGLIWRRPKSEERQSAPTLESLPQPAAEQPQVLDKLPPTRAESPPAARSEVRQPDAAKDWVKDFATMPATDESRLLRELPNMPAGFEPQPRFWENSEVKQPGEREPGTLPTPILPGVPEQKIPEPEPVIAEDAKVPEVSMPARHPEHAVAEVPKALEATELPSAQAPERQVEAIAETPRAPETPKDAQPAATEQADYNRLAATERATAQTRKVKAYLLHERERLAEELTPEAVDYVEWLGGAIVNAEQRFGEQRNDSPERTETGQAPEATSPNSSMDRAELLAVAEAIRIDGVSVKEMFLARRIDEQGVRRIVIEFLRGHDVRRVMTQEVIREQLKFERDPQMRHLPKFGRGGMGTRVGNVAKRAGAGAKKVANPERAKHHATRLGTNLLDGFDEAREVIDAHPQFIKVGGGIAAVVIYTTILILLITR